MKHLLLTDTRTGVTAELIFLLVFAYVLWAILLAFLARKKEIGSFRQLLISLFLTPVVGTLFYLGSGDRKMEIYQVTRYRCKRCKYVFTEEYTYCPYCQKDGYEVELEKTFKDMT